MKLHIVTVGAPKLAYAKSGWELYLKRLGHYHQVRVTHLADKWAYDVAHLSQAAASAYQVALAVEGRQLSSPELATFLDNRAQEGREVCLLVGGPEGLPAPIVAQADFTWSLSRLTFPHDLAMLVLLETLYRASTIQAGHPYHK